MSNASTREKFLDFYNSLRTENYHGLEEEGLTHISHILDDITFSAGYFADLLRKKHNIRGLPYSYFQIYDELDGITQDLKYFIGVLTLMHPNIANPTIEQGVYNMILEDQIYLRYATFAFQSIYNFWDRIGDLLYLYFETGLADHNVFIGRVLGNMPQKIKENPEYIALKDFYDSNLRKTMDERHSIVHHFQLKSKTRWDHVAHHLDMKKMKEDFERTSGYLAELKSQLRNCLKGYQLALALISILPDKESNLS